MFNKFHLWTAKERRPLALALPISLSKKKTETCLSEFRAGSEEAFSQLYQRFHKPIARYVASKIRDEETASEITQEVFIKVFRFHESYEEGYAFSTWLWTIARNTVTDHLRSSRAAQEHASFDGDEPLLPEEIPCPLKNAEALLLKKDERRSFLKLMRSMTRMQKRVIWMRAIHQLSYPEIAKSLGLSLAAVKNLSHRAKQSLQEAQATALRYA